MEAEEAGRRDIPAIHIDPDRRGTAKFPPDGQALRMELALCGGPARGTLKSREACIPASHLNLQRMGECLHLRHGFVDAVASCLVDRPARAKR